MCLDFGDLKKEISECLFFQVMTSSAEAVSLCKTLADEKSVLWQMSFVSVVIANLPPKPPSPHKSC